MNPIHPLRFTLLAAAATGIAAADTANTQAVVTAANTFLAPLTTAQKTAIDSSSSSALNTSAIYNASLTNVEVWSNVPISTTLSGATRNGLIFSSLSDTNKTNALAVATAALSTSGRKLIDDVRAGDRYISGEVTNAKGTTSSMWGYNKYFIAFVGTPSTSSPWTFQFGGHHLAYNLTYNGTYTSCTPLFVGTEPNSWTDSTGSYAPLGSQRTILESLRPTLTTSALLSGTYSDVVFGPNGSGPSTTSNHDTVQPKAYPTTGRGQLYSSLTSSQQALVKSYIESWVNFMAPSIAAELLPVYESDAALAETYVGYAGSNTLMRASSNYFRVDGPRLWIEFSVQGGVYDSSGYHDHGVVRDKLADYGAAYGSTTIGTTVRPPTITTQPTSQSIATGGSTTLSVVAASAGTGTSTLTYQWFKDGTAISGATASSFAITSAAAANAGSYTVQVISTGGLVTSAAAVVTIVSNPTITTTSPLADGTVGAAYSQTLAASSGTSPYTWSLASGSVPTGTTLSSAGTLSGTPTAAGTFTFTAKVTDAASGAATKSISVTIVEPFNTFLATYSLTSASANLDADQDGAPTLLEFVLGGVPTTYNTSILPVVSYATVSGVKSMVLDFNTVNPLGSVNCYVQYSADLTTWTTAVSGTDGVTITTTATTSTVNHVKAVLPATPSKRFARLKATYNP
ncbi:DUF3500 domain-containing protein [Luteolibacter sp. LG18]|uniref:DUF3500 domain-containing protein n=1 Tax=Luteolibacter sp. LG18 TaxID=2819286 RepID=UPI002B2B6877|nr:hypothetical protein llg_32550 [Luteolibacter sp. LG18]